MNMYDRNYLIYSQQTFTGSKSARETLEKGARYSIIDVILLSLLLTLNTFF